MILRNADESEMHEIYLMGFDTWSEGESPDEYITICEQSSKYHQGTWKVLCGGETLLSSLIIYRFKENVFGIGSIATPKRFRRNGFASILIEKAIDEIKPYSKSIFLYSDIKPCFYEKFGFIELEEKFQRYNYSKCMKLDILKKNDLEPPFIPDYF